MCDQADTLSHSLFVAVAALLLASPTLSLSLSLFTTFLFWLSPNDKQKKNLLLYYRLVASCVAFSRSRSHSRSRSRSPASARVLEIPGPLLIFFSSSPSVPYRIVGSKGGTELSPVTPFRSPLRSPPTIYPHTPYLSVRPLVARSPSQGSSLHPVRVLLRLKRDRERERERCRCRPFESFFSLIFSSLFFRLLFNHPPVVRGQT